MADVPALIVGIILFVAVGVGITKSLSDDVLNLVPVTNESFSTAGNGTILSLANEPVSASTDSVGQPGRLFTRGTNYTINNADATVTVLTNLSGRPALNVSYQYEPSGYQRSTTSRTVIGLIVVMMGIGAMLFVAKGIGMSA